jgi:hypothetical protein
MGNENIVLSIATRQDADDLTSLLRTAYSGVSDFTVKTDEYFEEHFSPGSAVLLAHSGEELIGTMRVTVIRSSLDLNGDDKGHLTQTLCPAFLLSRAATVRDKRAKGLNSLLRLLCLEAAIELRAASVIGFVYQDAPRVRLMTELGYQLVTCERCDRTHLH